MFNVFLTIFLFASVLILLAGESMILDIVKKQEEIAKGFMKDTHEILESQLKYTQLVDRDLDRLIAAINNLAEEQDQTKKTVDILHGECLKANVDKQEAPKKKGRKKKAKDIDEVVTAKIEEIVTNREDLEKL